ncbi:DegT/DnrJ/EryC1/StrS family aminotransferase [Anditalea andensis]|uniref:Pyridoxal phosphate-dependent aminotransferase n=1 Tax=Anditalea andensis TaxID=1048983 RepID=A0A074L4H1_9BACT|nr:DegT/DnrJ/EryC1/StrS family aminotransferase [Anditalea andensis]KEO74758.1 pyridoxal phosphate-dependent aminotransferase [Anditalea andensis]
MGLKKILLSPPHIGSNEKKYIEEAFTSNWIAPIGPNVDGFEKDISDFLGCGHVAALSSGTAAIHLSLVILGIKPGDCVICPTLSFTASAAPIVYQGAEPIFIDSEEDTYNMCPILCEAAIQELLLENKKPKAIIIVHIYGMPAHMADFLRISHTYNIPLIEDAAEALGSTYRNFPCGAMGDFGIFSFNGNKIITTGGGGALVSPDKNLIQRARYLASHAREQQAYYQHSEIGYNYRLSNISAGIGRGQMELLGARIHSRRANYKRYHNFFSDFKGIKMQSEPSSAYYSNCWLTTIVLDPVIWDDITIPKLTFEMEQAGIESRPFWKPLHLQPVYRHARYFGSDIAQNLFERGICLPSGSNLKEDDFQRIFDVFLRLLKRSKAPVTLNR